MGHVMLCLLISGNSIFQRSLSRSVSRSQWLPFHGIGRLEPPLSPKPLSELSGTPDGSSGEGVFVNIVYKVKQQLLYGIVAYRNDMW